MKLPLLLSVPHSGVEVPPEVANLNILSHDSIVRDGDEGAAEIYALNGEVAAVVTTATARAFVDVNRPEHDRSADGVVKQHTIYKEPVYSTPLPENTVELLLERYYRPYHRGLEESVGDTMLGIDCHTMAAEAPPICSDEGTERPLICLSNADGTCPDAWLSLMAKCLCDSFGFEVSLNDPFKGGYTIRTHARKLPWMQLELSRAQFMDLNEKRATVLRAFEFWCDRVNRVVKREDRL